MVTDRNDLTGPLAGVRVVDWTTMGVGPFAGALLGILGADVVKVEPPGGDHQYHVPPKTDGVATLYLNFNTNKRGVHFDLRTDDGREAMWRLIERSDVMVNNFRYGVADRLGFGYEAVCERNPGIVYVQATGFGARGPMAYATGGDHWIQVFSGWCNLMGREGGRPELLRFLGHLDMNTSLYIVASVLTGLYARDEQGGFGLHVGMTESALAMQSSRLAEYLLAGVLPEPLGSAAGVVAPSQAFRAQDRIWIAVAAEDEGQWARLCDALGRADLRERFPTNADRVRGRHELAAALQDEIGRKPAAWWTQYLQRSGVPCSRFLGWDELKDSPQVLQNEHVIQLDTGRCGFVHTNGPPWKFSSTPVEVRRPAYSGEHTEEILRGLAEPVTETRRGRVSLSPPTLAGLKVLELATGIAGPYCGSLFVDNGAEVMRVEPPEGDYLRGWGPPFIDGIGVAFLHLNHAKQHVVEPSDETLRSLVEDADVIIVDFQDEAGSAVAARAMSDDPEKVVVSISPYGERGPLAQMPGSELIAQALTETFAGLGTFGVGEEPLRVGADQASMNAGLTGYQGALAALFHRRRTGKGQRVAVSLLGALSTVRGLFWASLSRPDEWCAQLEAYMTGPSHGLSTATVPVLMKLNMRLRDEAERESAEALASTLGAELPVDLDPLDPGPLASNDHPSWVFWETLFKALPADELAEVVADHGGQVVPLTDYATLDSHPQLEAMDPYEDGTAAGVDVRFVRPPWRLLTEAKRQVPAERATAGA